MLILVTEDGQLLLHHRDEKPGVLYPGHWSGFGGGVEPGETVEEALVREMEEETGIHLRPGQAHFMEELVDPEAGGRLVTCSYLRGGVALEDIELGEGQGVGLFSYQALDGLLLVPYVRALVERHLLGLLVPGPDGSVPAGEGPAPGGGQG